MPLDAGARLGPYEIASPLGRGGMGEVYKARDTRLDRTVAIKVIHGLVASDEAMRERFEREARAVSSLNHPHICTLHDVGSEGGVDFLVMEHLEGESLADRLKRGRLAFDEALRYAVEIADALDAAHRQGVVHRDLKPGNVMLTPSGAKLLDFGLAKTTAGDGPGGDEDSALPTAGKPLTEKGAILGTFQYMAPEQLEGREADARTDIFSFGVLLYEMLTGHKAFSGDSQASLITAIMSAEPEPIARLQPMSPVHLEHVVGRCLEKDPESRWQAARDVKLELDWIRHRPQASQSPVSSARSWRERLGWALLIVSAVVVTAAVVSRFSPSRDASVIRTEIALPVGFEIDNRQDSTPFAISPDGSRIVYCALGDGGESRLFVRGLDQFEATALAGTENAINPIFSPDGQWVAYFANGKLLKVSIEGGAPIEVTDAPFGSFGATWGADGNIVFDNAFARGGLLSVAADGGDVQALDVVDDTAHFRPRGLPGGRGILLHVGNLFTWRGAVRPAGAEGPRPLRGIPENAILWGYVPSGHLVYTVSGTLWAVAFDLATLETSGDPAVVLDGIYSNGQAEHVAISSSGTLVYAVAENLAPSGATLAWVDREGSVTRIPTEPAAYNGPRLSPDGMRVAVSTVEPDSTSTWIFDVTRGTRSRFGSPDLQSFSWTPDGQITYTTLEGIYNGRADGRGEPRLLLRNRTGTLFEPVWSPDGESLVFYEMNPSTGRDIWLLPKDGEPVALAATAASERSPRLSPDGRWLAYASDESGRDEVYVQAFPGPGQKRTVSTDGGREPVWSRDGTELFYRQGDEILVVDVASGEEFDAGAPRTLLRARFVVASGGRNQNYDVSPDGQRFVFVQRDENVPRRLRVVVNWTEELERLARP